MSKTIRTNGPIVVDTRPDSNANINVYTSNFIIDGNLAVSGTVNTVNIDNTNIIDRFVVLNQGEEGAGVTLGSAGIYVDRGTENNVGIVWNETVDQWQYTLDGTTWISFGSGGLGGGLNNVVEDATPQLGGNLDLNTFDITGTGNININGSVVLFATQPNEVTIDATVPGPGGSGLTVTNSAGTSELVTKQRALAFAMIL